MFTGILHSTIFALQNFFRNWWLSVISIFLMVLTSLSITLIGGLNIVGQKVIKTVEQKVDINLFFYSTATETQILAAQEYLKSMPEVAEVVYVSPNEALSWLKTKHANDPEFLASLAEIEPNVLPASLVMRARSINAYPKIVKQFQTSPYNELVEKTDYSDNQEVILRISQLVDRASQVGGVVSVIFVVISVIVIFNMIRLAIYSHREEVGIMKLVGATNWFIRSPFILESIFLGFLAALLTMAIFYLMVYLSNSFLQTFFDGYGFSPLVYLNENLLILAAAEVLGAVLLSVFSSMVAINRYLKI